MANNPWITIKEACELLGVTPNTVRKLIRTGILPGYEVKGVRGFQIKRGDVEALIRLVEVKSVSPKGKRKKG